MFTKDMELNESSNNKCATSTSDSSVRKSSIEECNSTINSNGDSGYHSDLSGYHKESDYLKLTDKSSNSDPLAAMPSKKFGNEFSESVSTSPTYTNNNHHTVSENLSNPLRNTIESENMLPETGHNGYNVLPKHYNDHTDIIKTTLQTIGASSSLPLTCASVYSSPSSHTVQSSPSIISVGHCVSCSHNHLPNSEGVLTSPKASELPSCRKNEDWSAIIHDLALKIEFCVMFGFTTGQIKTAVTKLSYKASKNDILAELSSVQQNVSPVLPPTTISLLNSFDHISYDTLGPSVGDAISHDVDISHGSEAQARGPLSVPDEKAGNSGRSSVDDSENLRPIVIDGSNVAMSHGNKQYFSCKGILLAVDYFRTRNHRDITVFVPNYRKELPRSDALVKDREILDKLEEERILVYTPSRHIKGKRVTCYDDRFILRLAQETEGVIVSNDNFRDLQNEKPEWKELVEKRLLMYSFASDRFMPPDDPLGRNGPSIDNFLRKRPASEEQNKPQCPYGKKCTFGKKCKYFHPECARPVSERMKKSEKRLKATTESIELAIELTRSFRAHNPSVPGNNYPRDNLYPKESQTQEGAGQIQENKLNPSDRWKMDNDRQRRPTVGVVHESPMYNRNHGSNRVYPGSIPTEPSYTSASGYSNQSVRSDAFRLVSAPNHYPVPQNLPMSCGHANSQVCFETQCQKYQFESARVGYPSAPYGPAESGPPDFHLENKSSFSSPQANQPYQRSSPANLQVFDRANSGNGALLQRQHMNLVPPYSVAYQISPNPVYPSGYSDSHFQPNQHLMHSYPVPHSGSGNPNLHHNMINPPYFVAPINSTGSNGSLSHSYPFVTPEKSIVSPPISQRSLTNSSTGSDSKTYPPRAPRGFSTPPGPDQHARPYVSSTYGGNDPAVRHQNRMNAGELPLSNVNNPRHYLYKNLCSLFQRHVVEAVMMNHPEIRDPKKIVKMCLENN